MTRKRIKVTYSNLSSPDPLLHEYFDEAVAEAKASVLGRNVPMWINGAERYAANTFTNQCPGELSRVMGTYQSGSADDARDAVAAAKAAFPGWSRTPWQERVAILRRAADLISERLFEIGAIVSIEVGKNRLEALGDVEETADLIRYCCDQVEKNDGYVVPMLSESPRHHNRSVLKPHGVWAVISPFNFPFALAGGPTGGALVAGNTVVFKPASDTAFTGWMLAAVMRDAGLPDGVFNFVTGGGRSIGQTIVDHPDVAGITFTGSYDVGMNIIRSFAGGGRWPRPCIAEMGGKNATIVSNKADLDKAAIGVMRSAFGLQGQKCSACSRILVHEDVADAFTEKLVALTSKIVVGDPTLKESYMGPVVNQWGYEDYQKFVADLAAHGRVLFGGQTLEMDGYYVQPTLVDNLPWEHALWKQEMFLPISTIGRFRTLDEAMEIANDIEYGLTAGIFSEDPDEVQWFLENIESGVVYANRESGATTGAWPGYQAFGGWKGSGSTGKAAGSVYYVPQYLREQSQTVVE